MKTIHLLPISDPKLPLKDYGKAMKVSQIIAATMDYIPDSLETLQAIDYIDFKIMMKYNDRFFAATVKLCEEIIQRMIRDAIKPSRRKSIKTLDDFLNSGYYAENYEASRQEFINVLAEDYLSEYQIAI